MLGTELAQYVPHLRRIDMILHFKEIGFREILQLMLSRVPDELVKIDRRIGRLQLVVVNLLAPAVVRHALQFLLEQHAIEIGLRVRLGRKLQQEKPEQGKSLLYALLGLRDAPDV